MDVKKSFQSGIAVFLTMAISLKESLYIFFFSKTHDSLTSILELLSTIFLLQSKYAIFNLDPPNSCFFCATSKQFFTFLNSTFGLM